MTAHQYLSSPPSMAKFHEIVLQLSDLRDLDELCRQAVQLGHERLGFGRLSLWLLAEEPESLRGAFGIDEHGALRDQHDVRLSPGPDSPLGRLLGGGEGHLRCDDVPLLDERGQPVGRGALLVARLWDGERVVGVLQTDTLLSPDPLPAETEILFTFYADVVARLWSRLLAEERRRVLRRLAVAASEVNELQTFLDLLVEALAPLAAVDSALIYLLDRPGACYRLAAHAGISAALAGALQIAPLQSEVGHAVLAGKPSYGLALDLAQAGAVDSDLVPATGVQATAVLPVRRNDEVIGAVVFGARTRSGFAAAERELLEAVAAQVGGVIARLDAERARRRGEANLRLLFDSLDDLVLVLDESGRLVHCNLAAVERLGGDRAPLLGRAVHEWVAGGAESEDGQAVRALLAGESPLCTATLVAADGTAMPAEWKAVEGTWDHACVTICLVRDITERQRAEEDRRRLDEALWEASKMQAVARLAGGMAHEYNNLLTAILGYSGFALEALDADDPVRADLEQVRASAQRAAELTRQLTAFAVRQRFRLRPVHVGEVVRGAEPLLRHLLGERITLEVETMATCDTVLADPAQLEQVLSNLALNAREAMVASGRVHITTATLTLDAARAAELPGLAPGEYLVLTVRDTGRGMDAETRARAFEPFFTTKPPGEGAGLGLAAAYGIVRQHEGAITLDSEPGCGTTVRIYLPLQAKRTASAPATGGHTVLLVDDEPAVRGVVARVLKQAGYTVVEAAGVLEALERLAAHAADVALLITDMVMPDGSGVDLADRLLAERPHLPVLFISGYTSDVIDTPRLDAANVAYLQKPFTNQQLLARIDELLGR